MPPTIQEPPKAPMRSRMIMPPLTPPNLSARAFSKSAHVMTFLSSPMLRQTAVATMREICEAPESVSSPKIETTIEMSATSKTSGTQAKTSSIFCFKGRYATFSSFLRIEKMKSALTRQMPARTAQMYGRATLAPQSKPGI